MSVHNEEREINIYWDGPFSHDELSKVNSKLDYGLYAVYGHHPLYASDKLIYIGKTEQQTFASRLKDRGVVIGFADPKNTKIYLGRIYKDSIFLDQDAAKNNVENDINLAEKLLIFFLRPSNNSSNINSHGLKQNNIRIFNYGSYRDLPIELSSKRIKEEEEYQATKQVKELQSALKIKFQYEVDEVDDNDEYCGFNFGDYWIGLDYILWSNHIGLVFEVNHGELYQGFNWVNEDENQQYYPLYGKDMDSIINAIQKIIDKIKS